MNIENLMKTTNNLVYNEKRDKLINEVINKSTDIFMQTFDKDQLNELYNKFVDLNNEAKDLGVEFLDEHTHKGTFIHMVIKTLVRNDHYGKNVV